MKQTSENMSCRRRSLPDEDPRTVPELEKCSLFLQDKSASLGQIAI